MEQSSKSKNFRRYLPAMILTVLGLTGGYLYYRFVGCVSGTCMITGNPVISTIYGGVMGLLIGIIVTPGDKKKAAEENE